MEKIKAIKSTEKLCWKCLQEKDDIHKIEFGPLGYGSAFDCCSTKTQLCDECYKVSCQEIWSDELIYDNEECKEYDWSHYKYEDDMYDFAKEVDGNMKFIALLIQFVDVPNISGIIRVFDESGTDLEIKVVDAAFSRKKKERAGYR